jgi:hypothetical protein
VRASGLAYAVVRPTGMGDDAGAAGPALLEASQGDRISGKVARADVAAAVAAAAGLPAASNKTIEVRRQAAADAQGAAIARDMLRMFLGAAPDVLRTRVGLEPFPAPAPPPPPPSEQRMKEILGDARVQDAQRRGAGGRVRGAEEAAAAGGVAPAADGRAEASPAGEGASGEVREWVRRWRARSLETNLPQGEVVKQ